jgi:Tol biopolymer transport system component
LAVSPDGSSLAYSFFERATKAHRVMVREISGGSEREVFRVQAPRALVERGSLDWTPDGRHLVVVESGSRDRVPRLWSVPLAGGEPREIMRFQDLIYPRLHPDGRRLLLRGGESVGEVWVLERPKAPPPSTQSP